MENTPPARHPEPVPQGARGRVLVVHDDPTVAEVVVGHPHRAGYAVEQADDGRAALSRFAARRPDRLDLARPAHPARRAAGDGRGAGGRHGLRLRGYLRQIRTEAERMNGMAGDLFELSRIQAGSLTLATIDEVPVEVDGKEMSRVLGNLLINAIRRTPPAGAGLGLAILRGTVEAHAGRAEVRNVQGGCCFSVTLPTA